MEGCGVGEDDEDDSPLRLILLKHFPLGVVAHDFDVDEAAQIKLLRPELRHVVREGKGKSVQTHEDT